MLAQSAFTPVLSIVARETSERILYIHMPRNPHDAEQAWTMGKEAGAFTSEQFEFIALRQDAFLQIEARKETLVSLRIPAPGDAHFARQRGPPPGNPRCTATPPIDAAGPRFGVEVLLDRGSALIGKSAFLIYFRNSNLPARLSPQFNVFSRRICRPRC